jgi:pimeloyl-ACP methyl ester carboxylesterase
MTTTDSLTARTGPVTVGDAELWVDQRGSGPDVLLCAGLSDPAEAWEPQLQGLSDRYRVTAFDNRGAGRSPMLPEGFTVADMADDAAAILRELGISAAHVAGFSGGSITAQQLALRHPELVRSLLLTSTWARPDAYLRSVVRFFGWLPDGAPSERAMLEAFFLWIYTPRAHNEGVVDQIIEEALAFPHPQPPEAFKGQLEAWTGHDDLDRERVERLHEISVPTLVLAGELDIASPPRYGRVVAEQIPGAEFVVLPGEAHQPFQESPDQFNALVDDFWRRVDGDQRPVGRPPGK